MTNPQTIAKLKARLASPYARALTAVEVAHLCTGTAALAAAAATYNAGLASLPIPDPGTPNAQSTYEAESDALVMRFAAECTRIESLRWPSVAELRLRTERRADVLLQLERLELERSMADCAGAASRVSGCGSASTPDPLYTDWEESVDGFDQMGLKDDLLHGIVAYGFAKPWATQSKGIVPFTKSLDVIQQAQPGAGKTTTFCVGILNNLDYNLNECQALVLAPTSELALQIEKAMCALGDSSQLKCHACVPGTSVRGDARILSSGVQVVVGTPGRVFDMLRRRYLRADKIKMFVLDEANELLSRGYMDQIYDIFQLLPPTLQVGVSTPMLSSELVMVLQTYMKGPVRILVKLDERTLEGIRQFYIDVDKLEKLCDLHQQMLASSTQSAIVVAHNPRKVDWLTKAMCERGYIAVSGVHGSMDQGPRDEIMQEFDKGSCRTLITTDQFARTIKVQQASLVINCDLPKQPYDYLRRISILGPLGRKGTIISLVTKDDEHMLQDIQRLYNTTVKELRTFADLI